MELCIVDSPFHDIKVYFFFLSDDYSDRKTAAKEGSWTTNIVFHTDHVLLKDTKVVLYELGLCQKI